MKLGKCKCGKRAEVEQVNIFDEVEAFCGDCFNELGKHEEIDVIEWNRTRSGYATKWETVG